MPTTDTATGDDLFHTAPEADGGATRVDGGRALSLRRIVGASCLPALFLVMAVGTAIDPLDDSAPAGPTIAVATAHTGVVATLAWLELLAAVLCTAGLLTFVGAVRRRGAGVANAVGALGVLSGTGMAVISLNHLVVVGLVRSGLSSADAVKALDGFHAAGGPVVVLFLLLPLTYLLVAVAAWRAGLVPKAALLLGLLFALTSVVPGPAAVEFVSLGVGLVLTAWVGRGLLAQRS